MLNKSFIIIVLLLLLVTGINAIDFRKGDVLRVAYSGSLTNILYDPITYFNPVNKTIVFDFWLGDAPNWENIYQAVSSSNYTNFITTSTGILCTSGGTKCTGGDLSYVGTDAQNKTYAFFGGYSSSGLVTSRYYFANGTINSILYTTNNQISDERFTVSNPSYTFWIYNGDNKYYGRTSGGFTQSGSSNIGVPSSYDDPLDIKAVSCGGAIHLIALGTDNILRDHILNVGTLSYRKTETVSYDNETIKTTDAKMFNVYCDSNSTLWLAFVDKITYQNVILDSYKYFPHTDPLTDSLVLYSSNNYYMGDYDNMFLDPIVAVVSPSFFRDSDGFGWLGFGAIEPVGGYNVIELLREDNYCSCSDWVNDGCDGVKMKQSRTCSPTDCTQQERFIDSTYCSYSYNASLGIYTQRYQTFANYSSCSVDWVTLDSTESPPSCSPPPITIPLDCLSVNVTETTTVYETLYGGLINPLTCTGGKGVSTSCTPNYNCNATVYDCPLVNSSRITSYDYVGGMTATGLSSALIEKECSCQSILAYVKFGVKEYRIDGQLRIECQLACAEKDVCLNPDYTTHQYIDCQQYNSTYCQLGCDVNTGKCKGASSPSSSNALTDPLTALSGMFLFSESTKFLIWIIITVACVVGVNIWLGNKSNMMINAIVGLGILVVGILLGWIPFWIIFLIIIVGILGVIYKK